MARPSISLGLFHRRPDTHKGDYGHVLVVGGSVGLTGAPVLCALGALRSGAGLVTVGVPESAFFIVAAHLVEAMPVPLPEVSGGYLSTAAFAKLRDLVIPADAVALGPGLSQHPVTQRCVRQFLLRVTQPLVVDADGLNALVGHTQLLARVRAPVVVTPHPGELARLIGHRVETIQSSRIAVARATAKRWGTVVVLKGHRTIVASPAGRVYVNTTGNPGMATGGMGDVLTGIIAGFLGQGFSAFDAAAVGVYVHGTAGDVAAKAVGPVGLLATDVAACVPAAIRRSRARASLPT